jgi:allophanate hydrolase subunit 2
MRLDIAPPTRGYRVYVAFAGAVKAESLLGSVSPLPARNFENSVAVGERLVLGIPATPPLRPGAAAHLAPLIAGLHNPGRIGVLQTAQAEVFDGMERLYSNAFQMSPRSNAVGARFDGETPVRRDTTEITSRSVPIGSIEIPATGELIALLRGRLITAGYPIPAVIARADIDAVSQLRPGDAVQFERIDESEARWRVLHQEAALRRLTEN